MSINILILPEGLSKVLGWVRLVIFRVGPTGHPIPLGGGAAVSAPGGRVTGTLQHTLRLPTVLLGCFLVIVTDTAQATVLLGAFLLLVLFVYRVQGVARESTQMTDAAVATTCNHTDQRSEVMQKTTTETYQTLGLQLAGRVHALVTS